MKTVLVAVATLVLGLVVGLILPRFAPTGDVVNPILDEVLPLPVEPVPEPPAPAPDPATLPAIAATEIPPGRDRFGAQQLAGLSIRSCWTRPAEFTTTPPGWMQRAPLSRFNAAETPIRPHPDLARLPGLIKFEQIRSPSGNAREHCAGVRIAPNWVLTAAHCVKGGSFDSLLIHPREDVAQQDARIIPVDNALCHDAWYSATSKFDDDIALLHVADATALDPLAIIPMEADGDVLTLSDFIGARFGGWSKNGDNRFLQGGPVAVNTLGNTYLTASPVEDFGPCVGDSGGPLFVDRPGGPITVGVLSAVTDDTCPPYGEAFYIRVKSYRSWIDRAIATCAQDGRFLC
jgi:hypothetical protein